MTDHTIAPNIKVGRKKERGRGECDGCGPDRNYTKLWVVQIGHIMFYLCNQCCTALSSRVRFRQ